MPEFKWGTRIEANIVGRCNARCLHCNKGFGVADGIIKDMTLDQIKRAVDQLIEQRIRVTRFTFCGGEPVLNKDLQGMIYEVARLPGLRWGRVLSNGLESTQHLRDKITLPRKFTWVINPLDDPTDPLSGKNDPTKRENGRFHVPFWISPDDYDEESKFEYCGVRTWCGIGLDAEGWSMCGKAVMFGKLLGIDASMRDGDIKEHVLTPIEDICKHCKYGLPDLARNKGRRALHKQKQEHKKSGRPDISPTFEKAFELHNSGQKLVQLEDF